jgi:hypothetical protein
MHLRIHIFSINIHHEINRVLNIQKRCTIWRYLLFWTPGISFCILIWIEVYMSPYFSRVNLNCDLELTVPCRCFSFWDGSGLPSFHMLGKFGLGLGRCVHFLTLLELFFPFLRVISCTARIDIPLIFLYRTGFGIHVAFFMGNSFSVRPENTLTLSILIYLSF